MCKDGKCELRDGVVEDVHFLLHCGEFAGDGGILGMTEGIGD